MGLKSIVSIIPHYRRWGANTFQCVTHVPLGNKILTHLVIWNQPAHDYTWLGVS